MNKREKRLMIVTAIIVAIGGLTWLVGGDDEPPIANAATTAPAAGNAAIPVPLGSAVPVAFEFAPDALANLLAIRSQPQGDIPTTDPFIIQSIQGEPRSRRSKSSGGKFYLNGVFISKHSRGAIINGVSYFEGDSLDPDEYPNSRLITVQPDEVEIQVRDRRIVVPLRVIPNRDDSDKGHSKK